MVKKSFFSEDENELTSVFEEFKERMKDEFEFVDGEDEE